MHDTKVVKDPPQKGGVIVAPQVDRASRQIVGIAARRAIEKNTTGKNRPIRVEPNQEVGKNLITPTARDR